MTSEHATGALLLGGPGAGKTTLLTQLYGRLQAGRGVLRARSAPASLGPIQASLRRLEQGLAVRHTSRGTDVVQSLPAVHADGTPVDVWLPDYAGEALQTITVERRLPDQWRRLALQSDHWLFLIRLSQYAELPDILTRPVGAAPAAPPTAPTAADAGLPLDLLAVELLQILWYARGAQARAMRRQPLLTLVLSCWDEVGLLPGARPDRVAHDRLSLVRSFCLARWAPGHVRILGVSAQGRSLAGDQPAAEYLDRGPQGMGWLVLPDGTRDRDLTRLLVHP